MPGSRRLRLALSLLFTAPLLLSAAPDDRAESAPRAITLDDAVQWKHIAAPALSPDGAWLAYRFGPELAPGEVVARSTRDQTERRFQAGEPPRAPVGAARPPERGAGFSFSQDSRLLAYVIYPDPEAASGDGAEAQKPAAAAPQRRKLGLVELATGESIELDAVASYAFAGERADWIAIHKAGDPARAAGRGGSGASQPAGGAAKADRRKRERPGPGSDLLLRQLETGRTLTLGHVTEYAFDRSGRFLAWAVLPEDETGAGVHLRDLETGVVRILASGGDHYTALRWLEEGDALAFLEGREDETWEQDLYLLWGFSGFSAGEPIEVRWNPAEDAAAPAEMSLHPKQRPYWLEDRSAIVFGLRPVDRASAEHEDADENDRDQETGDDDADLDAGEAEQPKTAGLVIWHWLDQRLPSQQRVEEQRDRDRSSLALLRLDDRSFVRLADDDLLDVTLEENDRFAIGLDRRPYELDGTLDGRRYQDVWAIDPRTGERWLAAERVRWYYGLSPQGDRFLLYRDRAFWAYDLERRALHNLTGELPTSFVDLQNDRNVVDPPVEPLGWSEDGRWVLLADNWDVWKVAAGGDRAAAVNVTRDGASREIRYRRAFRLDPDDEGLDLTEPLYLGAYGERTKRVGIARLEPGADRTELLLWEDAAFTTLIKAEDAPVLAFTRETPADYADLSIAGPDLRSGRRVTHAGAQRDAFSWSSERLLLDYQSERGDALQATLHLPAGYQQGRRYPTIVFIYERLTPFHHRFYPPDPSGFSASAYTSGGYAVLMPDIRYHVNDPGMSAVWSVLPALDAAIATGVVDPERVGLHGHSWGGYQTAFLVTQTDRFAAAVAAAPLTNLISMYSSIYWNTGSANQPIFESSQGRFAGDFLGHVDAYVRNSPVFHARNVATPLLLLHNDKDGAVDWNQGIELFNILRRLRKPVVMLQYEGENHGLVKGENRRDYYVRMREFFDHHLRGEAAPRWLTDGVRRIDLERHLEERARAMRGQAQAPPS
ncbi:MAG TPA: prolyl oligopeptidase family serine peptidase [Thermoanaerobaculia bacterium]|nr:prolyl oligopeptidase family serine peptidase [Thermoanaerobaculia bacterium]